MVAERVRGKLQGDGNGNSQANGKFIVISSFFFFSVGAVFNTNIIVYVFTELPHIMGHPQGKEDRFADRYSHK